MASDLEVLTKNLPSSLSPVFDTDQPELTKMRIDPFPPWPAHSKPVLGQLEEIKETKYHTLNLQHFTLTTLNEDGTEGETTHHDHDVVKPKTDCPSPLAVDEDWERVLSDPVDLGGLKSKRVIRVDYRHKVSGVVESREVVVWQPRKFPGGVICRPYVHYSDGSKALLYLEEWRRETNKISICFPEGMMEYTSDGLAEKPLVAALRELREEGGVANSISHPILPTTHIDAAGDKVKITLLDQWRKDGLISVAIYGLEKGVIPEPDPEDDERIVVKVVPIDHLLKHHFARYTEENGYIVGAEFKEELDWIAANH